MNLTGTYLVIHLFFFNQVKVPFLTNYLLVSHKMLKLNSTDPDQTSHDADFWSGFTLTAQFLTISIKLNFITRGASYCLVSAVKSYSICINHTIKIYTSLSPTILYILHILLCPFRLKDIII